MKNRDIIKRNLKKIMNDKHGIVISTDKYTKQELDFYHFISNTPKNDGTFYTSRTSKNYVSAIKELKILLETLNEKEYELDSNDFYYDLKLFQSSKLQFPFGYAIGNKIANNFHEMNLYWKNTYSASIARLKQFVIYNKEVTYEYSNANKNKKNSLKEEGNSIKVLVNIYERNIKLRDEGLKTKGYSCTICNLNFEKTYGSIGKNFIHVHHELPLSQMKKQGIKLDSKNLYPFCPNCHSMIHKTNPLMSVKEFKRFISNNGIFSHNN